MANNYVSRVDTKRKKFEFLEEVATGNKNCTWNKEARSHLAAGMAQIPYASF
jgi:hypothetical protein